MIWDKFEETVLGGNGKTEGENPVAIHWQSGWLGASEPETVDPHGVHGSRALADTHSTLRSGWLSSKIIFC